MLKTGFKRGKLLIPWMEGALLPVLLLTLLQNHEGSITETQSICFDLNKLSNLQSCQLAALKMTRITIVPTVMLITGSMTKRMTSRPASPPASPIIRRPHILHMLSRTSGPEATEEHVGVELRMLGGQAKAMLSVVISIVLVS